MKRVDFGVAKMHEKNEALFTEMNCQSPGILCHVLLGNNLSHICYFSLVSIYIYSASILYAEIKLICNKMLIIHKDFV